MKQLTYVAPGSLEWREVPEPGIESALDAIVRPVAVATCDLDGAVIHGLAPLPGPFALGHESIARVVETGDQVSSVKPGDLVLVPFQISCGSCERCRAGLTGSCATAGARSAYGMRPIGGDWGSALSDYMRVPFADAMLVKVPTSFQPLASLADNIPDGWRSVAPQLQERPGAKVLILGGAGPSSVALYAVAVAAAMGAGGVTYVDHDEGRLEIASALGATVTQLSAGDYPKRFGPYPIVVDHTSDQKGLACAIRSTEPGGICTSTAIYFASETPLPLLEMYTSGLTYITGRVNARPCFEPLIALLEGGRFHPEKVTTQTADWDDAVDALNSYTTKLVITRN